MATRRALVLTTPVPNGPSTPMRPAHGLGVDDPSRPRFPPNVRQGEPWSEENRDREPCGSVDTAPWVDFVLGDGPSRLRIRRSDRCSPPNAPVVSIWRIRSSPPERGGSRATLGSRSGTSSERRPGSDTPGALRALASGSGSGSSRRRPRRPGEWPRGWAIDRGRPGPVTGSWRGSRIRLPLRERGCWTASCRDRSIPPSWRSRWRSAAS